MLAASEKHSCVVELLLAARADVEASDEAGWTAAHWASQACADVLQQLLNIGCNVNATSVEGATPLSVAAVWCNTETAELLLGVPGLSTQSMVGAARAAAAGGHADLAMLVFKALLARDTSAAKAVLADQAVAGVVLGERQQREARVRELQDTVRQLEARWPDMQREMQHLLVGIACKHKQLQESQAAAAGAAQGGAGAAAGAGAGGACAAAAAAGAGTAAAAAAVPPPAEDSATAAGTGAPAAAAAGMGAAGAGGAGAAGAAAKGGKKRRNNKRAAMSAAGADTQAHAPPAGAQRPSKRR